MCKYQFERAIEADRTLEPSYWGRALCDSQLLWGGENITSSTAFLRAEKAVARQRRRRRGGYAHDEEEVADELNGLYLKAVKECMSCKKLLQIQIENGMLASGSVPLRECRLFLLHCLTCQYCIGSQWWQGTACVTREGAQHT